MILVKAKAFLAVTAVQLVVLAILFTWSIQVARVRAEREVPGNRDLARRLELTDVAIWTEARYTRHPSQADFFAPFQDGPSSLEHFPAGSVVAAPESSTTAGPER